MTFVISLIKLDIGEKITRRDPSTEIKSEQEIKICHSLSVVVVVVVVDIIYSPVMNINMIT